MEKPWKSHGKPRETRPETFPAGDLLRSFLVVSESQETCGLDSFLSETTAQAGRFRVSELQG